MAYLPPALLETVLTGLRKKTSEEADSSQNTLSKVALEGVLDGSRKPVNMETDPLPKTSSEAALEAVSSGSQKRAIEENIQKNEAKRVKTDKIKVWHYSGSTGTYIRMTKDSHFLSFPFALSCMVVKDIGKFWMLTHQDNKPMLDALAHMIKLTEDNFLEKNDWDDAIARTIHLGMMKFPQTDSIFGDSTLDKLVTKEYEDILVAADKSEITSVWYRRKKNGLNIWMKQRHHKLSFPIAQGYEVMSDIVEEWSYRNSDYKPMLSALTQIFIAMINRYHVEKNWKVDQYRVLQMRIHSEDLADLDESENSLPNFSEALKIHEAVSGGGELDSQSLSANLAKYYHERDDKELAKYYRERDEDQKNVEGKLA